MNVSELTIDLLYLLAVLGGDVFVFISGGFLAGSFFYALTALTSGLIRGNSVM